MAALGPISIFLMVLDLLGLFFRCSRVFFSCEQPCHIAFPIQFFLLKENNIAFSVAGGVWLPSGNKIALILLLE
jgi:hypothetical protein